MNYINSVSQSRDFKAALFAICLLPCAAVAEEWNQNQSEMFDLDLDHIQELGLLPVGMMEDKALFLAASAVRDGLNMDYKFQMNLVWLMGKNVNTEKMRSQFNKKLRYTLWQFLTRKDVTIEEKHNADGSGERLRSILERYRVRLGQDQVSLQYVMTF